MSFTGTPTRENEITCPDGCMCVGDIVGIVSPYETPLLSHLGDPERAATDSPEVQRFSAYVGRPSNDLVPYDDELDYQIGERTRELLRDLEDWAINQAITPAIKSNVRNANGDVLCKGVIDAALQDTNGNADTILVGGLQKRAINGFMGGRSSVYERGLRVCRVVLSRWVPSDTAVLLDSSQVAVMPVAGNSFHYTPLPDSNKKNAGFVTGHYVTCVGAESSHGIIKNLSTK